MTQNVFTEQLTGSSLTLTSANGQSVALTASNTGSLLSGGAAVSAAAGAGGGGGGGGSGVTVYANSSVLPLQNLTAGDMAFANNNNTLYLTNGFGWYKIALINQTPTLTANVTSVSLGGSANTILIGYTVNEPDGTPVIVTVSNSGIADTSLGTVVHYDSNNTIEVNNFAAEGNEWTANVIISATDGVNVAVDSFTIRILYAPDPGGVLFTNLGSNSWTIPDGVNSFSAVAVGGGGGGVTFNGSGGSGGGGGALAYINEYPCTPGEVWTVFVGEGGTFGTSSADDGKASWIEDTTSTRVLQAGGGDAGLSNFSFTPNAPGGAVTVGDGGGAGGMGGGRGSSADAGGGGGAGGYSGAGGNGEGYNIAGQPGNGGGGGGGGAGGTSDAAGGGGGVGLYGEGTSGSGGSYNGGNGGGGGGGSGGVDGTNGDNPRGYGGNYGGGGGGSELLNENGSGGQGAVRIIWGAQRTFPSTNVEESGTLPDGTTETEV